MPHTAALVAGIVAGAGALSAPSSAPKAALFKAIDTFNAARPSRNRSLEGELKLHSMVNRFKVWNAQLSDDEVYSLYKFRESLVSPYLITNNSTPDFVSPVDSLLGTCSLIYGLGLGGGDVHLPGERLVCTILSPEAYEFTTNL
jgi:hypothetical protein